MIERFLVIKPDGLAIAIVNPDRDVVIHLRGLEKAAGLTPGLQVMIEMTPTEARQFAQALIRKADEAEGRSSLPQ